MKSHGLELLGPLKVEILDSLPVWTSNDIGREVIVNDIKYYADSTGWIEYTLGGISVVNYENLLQNGDIGVQSNQISQGNHSHSEYYSMGFDFSGAGNSGETVYTGSNGCNDISSMHYMIVPKTGIIVQAAVGIKVYGPEDGSPEPWSIYIRKNNSIDYLIQTISNSLPYRTWSNNSLNISVNQLDFILIKIVCPVWATPPNGTYGDGSLIILVT